MSNKWFSVLFLGFIAIGVFFGVRLSAVDNLETFKVLNVIGLFYDIVGLLILSEIFSENQSYQKFVADTFSGLFMWAHMGIPIGILLSGIGLTYFSGYPSSEISRGIGAGIMIWMIIPSFLIEDIVFRTKLNKFQTPQSRSRFLGGFLLLSGLLVQFVAAIKDLGV
ncbi:MAG: hypothetical protein ACW7DR_18325 [Paraglaciecola chathamensis]